MPAVFFEPGGAGAVTAHGGVFALPLEGFPPVVVGVLWRNKTPLLQAFLDEAQKRARQVAGGSR
ncbi:MAG TPA: hypothetical protein VNM37_18670 [Candidatus Dormibacteraeota bacterium]|nr:hypothetical protein [Candidatus Dormibacteraeota bacterium]